MFDKRYHVRERTLYMTKCTMCEKGHDVRQKVPFVRTSAMWQKKSVAFVGIRKKESAELESEGES